MSKVYKLSKSFNNNYLRGLLNINGLTIIRMLSNFSCSIRGVDFPLLPEIDWKVMNDFNHDVFAFPFCREPGSGASGRERKT